MFLHKPTGRLVRLPAHFATAKIAKNFVLLNDDFEEETDKVIISHAPNSQQRVGRKLKDKEPEVEPIELEEVSD